MSKVGIDAIGFYTPRYFLDLATLAKARDIDEEKFYAGLGQQKMSIAAPGEDIVTMAANAAAEVVTEENKQAIDTVLFATESGTDYSKAAGIYVHKLLDLPSNCRVVELKEACYAGTAAMQLGLALIRSNPERKILVIASDVAFYGFNTTGESSQGAGAVALLLSADPKLLEIEAGAGFYTEDVMDFWRPNYMATPIVFGKYSCEIYMKVLELAWQDYCAKSQREFLDHDYFCYHVSVPKLVGQAHKRLLRMHAPKDYDKKTSQDNLEYALTYGRTVGNCYTAALNISLLSLLETLPVDLTNKRIGLYSYGSGCVGEFFSAVVQPGYQQHLQTAVHQELIASRQELTYPEYEQFCCYTLPTDGSSKEIEKYNTGKFRLVAVEDHKRIYATAS